MGRRTAPDAGERWGGNDDLDGSDRSFIQSAVLDRAGGPAGRLRNFEFIILKRNAIFSAAFPPNGVRLEDKPKKVVALIASRPDNGVLYVTALAHDQGWDCSWRDYLDVLIAVNTATRSAKWISADPDR